VAEGLVRTLDEMARRDVDVLLLGRESNARFVSGATRLWLAGTRPFAPGCVVVRETGAVHLMSVTDFGVPPEIPNDRLYAMSWNPATIIGVVAGIRGVATARRIGVDGLTPLFDVLLGGALPDAELTDGEAVMRAARRVKSPAELERIRAAVAIAMDAMAAAVGVLRPGIRERELQGVFEERMCRLGTTTPAYEPAFCVVDGRAPTRAVASDRQIEAGDLVVMSAGVLLDGWEGSLARTWPCDTPPTAVMERWSLAHAARAQLLEACRAGRRVGDVRATAPDADVHGVGLGYEGLEDEAVLAPGMVVQFELETAGVLAGDTVLIGTDGPELLTTFPYPEGAEPSSRGGT
jgi:Xaa-Pro aminopeptidase